MGTIDRRELAVKAERGRLSYHNRNVPVLSTIEMSPSCGFTLPRKSWLRFFDESLVSRDDWQREKGCGVVSGKGARGKGQRPCPRSALEKGSVRGTPDAA